MANLKGTQTEKNILTAFAGESQARNRYAFFASQAKKEGYVQIAAVFEETANQEKEHAKRLFKLLEGGERAYDGATGFKTGYTEAAGELRGGEATRVHDRPGARVHHREDRRHPLCVSSKVSPGIHIRHP